MSKVLIFNLRQAYNFKLFGVKKTKNNPDNIFSIIEQRDSLTSRKYHYLFKVLEKTSTFGMNMVILVKIQQTEHEHYSGITESL